MTNRSPESREATSASPLALALATVLTSKIIKHDVLSEALRAGETKDIDVIARLKTLPQEDRNLLAQVLLTQVMPAIQATPDGETIEEVPENLFLIACALGEVSDADRQVYIAKHMNLTFISSIEVLAQDLVTMRVITADQAPSIVAQHQMVGLELPANETEGQ